MAIVMKYDDEIRLKILDALRKPRSISPNVSKLQEATKYHQVTIKKSLDFLEKNRIIDGYLPMISPRAVGLDLHVIQLLCVDFHNQKLYDEFIATALKDSNNVSVHKILGSGKWNMMIESVCASVEEFDNILTERYYKKIEKLNEFIKDKNVFYISGHALKRKQKAKAVIDIVKKIKREDRTDKKAMEPNDKIRLNILEALCTNESCLSINVSQVQKHTKLHMATIKASLRFLKENKILRGVKPNLHARELGLKLMPVDILWINDDPKAKKSLEKILQEDDNVFAALNIVGEGNWNLVTFRYYSDVKEYTESMNKNTALSQFVKDKMTFYVTNPLLSSGTYNKDSIIDILLRKKGLK